MSRSCGREPIFIAYAFSYQLSLLLFLPCFLRFHTGDLGKIDENGWVQVTGRIKEQYKLENGKYVVPTPVENALGNSRFINQVVLVGANRPHNVALIVPDWTAIRSELNFDDSLQEDELATDGMVKQLIDDEIRQSCSKLKKYEIPKDWAFVAPFTVDNNMLTPKMSIRRHNVVAAHKDVISQLYGEEPDDLTAEDDKEAA